MMFIYYIQIQLHTVQFSYNYNMTVKINAVSHGQLFHRT